MHTCARPTTDQTAYDDATLQTSLFPLPRSHPLPICEFLPTDQPRHRLAHQSASVLRTCETSVHITGDVCYDNNRRNAVCLMHI